MRAASSFGPSCILALLVVAGCANDDPAPASDGGALDAERGDADANEDSSVDADRDAARGDGGPPIGVRDLCANGYDDDNDGVIDEECNCSFGETQSCYTGPIATRGVGLCRDGAHSCDVEGIEFGVWPACTGSIVPAEESCNGEDDDCDGVVDESCPCTAGATRSCGSEFWVAPCMQGTQRCDEGTWSSCEGALPPAPEVCGDGVDNDCNALVDDTCECTPVPELCGDVRDNDCDGRVDEGCFCGLGERTCSTGELCCDEACVPSDYAETACGRCGVTCAAGSSCANGACCVLPSGTQCNTVRDVATGRDFACAAEAAGTVICWGWNDRGQLGDAAALSGAQPVRLTGLSDVVDVEAGMYHACARTSGGQVYCWGSNTEGQVGDGTTTARYTPALVSGLGTVTSIALGGQHSCAVVEGGALYCWGTNGNRESGSASPARLLAPTLVAGVDDVASVACGGSHTCARKTDGTVYCFGSNTFRQLGVAGLPVLPSGPVLVAGAEGAVALFAGGEDTCIRRADGEVRCWGPNNGNTQGDGSVPRASHDTPTVSAPLRNMRTIHMSMPSAHGCGIRDDGTVACWGGASWGALGDGTRDEVPAPRAVPGLSDVATLDVGYGATCAATTAGALYCWGSNQYKQLGDKSQINWTTPQPVPGAFGGVALSVAGYHATVRTSSGRVWFWGSNFSGESLDGSRNDHFSPLMMPGLADLRQHSMGYQYGCALLADATVRCWGFNTDGQLGDGTQIQSAAPVAVMGLTGVRSISAGENGYHTCAIREDGSLWCWGSNREGALGIGSTELRSTVPVRVPGLDDVRGVDLGDYATCAVNESGTVQCWGENFFGQNGDGSMVDNRSPVFVSGITDAVEVVMGNAHACVRHADGGVSCWGYNGQGQLGDGTTTSRPTPARIAGLSNVTALRSSHYIVCAVLADRTARCWGRNLSGELGDGTTLSRSTPTPVTGLTDVVDIGVGSEVVCALFSTGRVSCWGKNDHGQLGFGPCATHLRRLRPTPVFCE